MWHDKVHVGRDEVVEMGLVVVKADDQDQQSHHSKHKESQQTHAHKWRCVGVACVGFVESVVSIVVV